MFVCLSKSYAFQSSSFISRWISLTVQHLNFYKILGVKPNATNDEIKKAYLQKCKDYHPDRNKGSKELQSKFVEANTAYNTLSNVSKRKEYDARINNFSRGYSNQSHQWRNQTRARPEDVHRQYQRYHHDRYEEWSRYGRDPIYEQWRRAYESPEFSRNQNPFKQNSNFENDKAHHGMSKYEYRLLMYFFFGIVFIVWLRLSIAIRSYNSRSPTNIPDPDYNPNKYQNIGKFDQKFEKKASIQDLNIKTETV